MQLDAHEGLIHWRAGGCASQANFGEFRATILGMLDTYKYEERILNTANSLMEDDVRKRVRVLHRVSCVSLNRRG